MPPAVFLEPLAQSEAVAAVFSLSSPQKDKGRACSGVDYLVFWSIFLIFIFLVGNVLNCGRVVVRCVSRPHTGLSRASTTALAAELGVYRGFSPHGQGLVCWSGASQTGITPSLRGSDVNAKSLCFIVYSLEQLGAVSNQGLGFQPAASC